MWFIGRDVNVLNLKQLIPGLKAQVKNYIGKYYRVWCENLTSQNDYSKLYGCTTKRVEN